MCVECATRIYTNNSYITFVEKSNYPPRSSPKKVNYFHNSEKIQPTSWLRIHVHLKVKNIEILLFSNLSPLYLILIFIAITIIYETLYYTNDCYCDCQYFHVKVKVDSQELSFAIFTNSKKYGQNFGLNLNLKKNHNTILFWKKPK